MDTDSTCADVAPPNATPGLAHFGFVDVLKVCAAQLIVLHHLAFYGPMADHVRPFAHGLIEWLDTYGRIAVQVFLVIGGFLAAKSLATCGHHPASKPVSIILRRYLKLAPPFFVAILLTIGAYAWAGLWMTHDSISAFPSLPQLVSHALLLHGIARFDSISAGAWYVAIDMQLYAALALLVWLCARATPGRSLQWLLPCLTALCVAASLFYFNRDAGWDTWAPYFFGSYGLGALAWWASDPTHRRITTALLFTAMLSLTLTALLIDFRIRIAVALTIACSLIFAGRAPLPHWHGRLKFIHQLGRISYSVFLIHFAVCLVVNAAFTRFVAPQPLLQAAGMVLALAASLVAGAAFHRWVERPLDRLLNRANLARIRLWA